ncbi:uncharacterized protein LY89DRAFT_735519 [Mollisia scopiformis]|uniref:Uncharacterized protein n=1 Tax=Mollisia scopiformis TaxID=149040 RepID=A0A194X5F7_MOLSC|nr:uncharacterized protein LY89DRAFT_735519 [Mollisia scopiformis]KUJ15405.1 hypothetical protein LY89DRAFT_735519 [Mollisia scopiformis]
MASKVSSVCATNGSARISKRKRSICSCPHFNPYGRKRQSSSITTVPLDFPSYQHISPPSIPSLKSFNHDANSSLIHPNPNPETRKRKRNLRHDINFIIESAGRNVTYRPEAAHFSYSLARLDGSADNTGVRYAGGEEQSLDIRITRMRCIIKGFEKAFWQT